MVLCRTLDPILGVATGVFAYYLHETHPRTALPEESRLLALLQWKRQRVRQEHNRKLMATDDDAVVWQAITASVEVEATKESQK